MGYWEPANRDDLPPPRWWYKPAWGLVIIAGYFVLFGPLIWGVWAWFK